jgi:hypothetical protein
MHSDLKYHHDDNEEPKENDLDNQTKDNKLISHAGKITGDHHTCGTTLDQKGQDIAGNKELS